MDTVMINVELSYDNAEREHGAYGSEVVSNRLLGLFSHYELCDNEGVPYNESEEFMNYIECGYDVYLHNFKNYRDLKGLAYTII